MGYSLLLYQKHCSISWKFSESIVQGVPHLRGFHYCRSHYRDFWLMYAQVGNFRVSRGPHTVPLTLILRKNAVFFKSQNPRKAGTLRGPPYQVGWAILAECRQLDIPIKAIFVLCSENSPNLTCYIYTMRKNLLNWRHLVSISKNVMFYASLVVRIY